MYFLLVEYVLHTNSSRCEQMFVSNALGFCNTVRHFVGSSALRRSLWRRLNCFIERNAPREIQARSGCQKHTRKHKHNTRSKHVQYKPTNRGYTKMNAIRTVIYTHRYTQNYRVPGSFYPDSLLTE